VSVNDVTLSAARKK